MANPENETRRWARDEIAAWRARKAMGVAPESTNAHMHRVLADSELDRLPGYNPLRGADYRALGLAAAVIAALVLFVLFCL